MLIPVILMLVFVVLSVALTARRYGVAPGRYLIGAAAFFAIPNAFFLVNPIESGTPLFATTAPVVLMLEIIWGLVVHTLMLRGIRREAAPESFKKAVPYLEPFAGLVMILVGFAGLQTLLEGGERPGAVPLLAVGAAGLGWAAYGMSKRGWRASWKYLASAEAAALVLAAIMFATIAGTFVVQGMPLDLFQDRHGPLAGALLALHVDDVFHSGPIVACLAGLGVTSMATVALRRKSIIKWKHFGLLMSHVSVILVLIGGGVGMIEGKKGMIHLEAGVSSAQYVADPEPGERRGKLEELGFTVKLEKFQLDTFDLEHRFYTYAMTPEGEYELIAAHDAEVGAEVGALPEGADFKVKVERLFASLGTETVWDPDVKVADGAPARPAARVVVHGDGVAPIEKWMGPGGPQPGMYLDPQGRFELRLVWEPPSAVELEQLGKGDAEDAHMVEAPGNGMMKVEVGKSYDLADGSKLQIRKFLPDFAYDSQTRSGVSRSNLPKNPVLEVGLAKAGEDIAKARNVYLYARADLRKMMANNHPEAAKIDYQHVAARGSAPYAVIIVGKTGQRIEVAKGKVVGTVPMDWSRPFGLSAVTSSLRIAVDQPLRYAKSREVLKDIVGGPPRPAAEISIVRADGSTSTSLLRPEGRPGQLGDGRLLAYKERKDKIRNFHSTLSIIDGGQVIMTKEIRVNDPLVYKDWHLYQASYDPDGNRPTYSGIQAVRDPGLIYVEIGLWLLMFGVLQTVMMRSWRPVWRRRERKAIPKTKEATA